MVIINLSFYSYHLLNFNENILAQTELQQFLIGLAILIMLALIPFVGGLVVFLINLFGLGVILL